MRSETLPQIRYGELVNAESFYFLIPPTEKDLENLPWLKEKGKTRKEVRDYLEKAGFVLKIDTDTGEFSLFDFTIPASKLHEILRAQGRIPRQLASWLVGTQTNPLDTETGAEGRFYAKVENPRIEVGFFSLEQGETVAEMAHTHPECIEAFIILKGRVTFEVNRTEVVLDPKERSYFSIPSNTVHQLTKIEPGTQFIMLKRAVHENPSPNWPRREVI